jgi:CENP-S associating Centromere protein X
MPPARPTSVNVNRNTRPFKPPSRISNATTNSASIRKSNASSSKPGRLSNSASSKTKLTSDRKLDLSDEGSEGQDGSGSEVIEVDSSHVTATSLGRSRNSIRAGAPTTPRRRSTAVAAGVEDDPLALIEDDEDAPIVPRALLTRILFEGFDDKGMKISKDAMGVVELYTRIFVKEAIARSKQESRDQSQKMDNGNGISDDWLNVEDLEKIAPQLMLDF